MVYRGMSYIVVMYHGFYVFMFVREAFMIPSVVWVLQSNRTANLRSSVKNITRLTAGT